MHLSGEMHIFFMLGVQDKDGSGGKKMERCAVVKERIVNTPPHSKKAITSYG
jgi:hypothetical protein